MRKIFIFLTIVCGSVVSGAQELYPYTEPASNMPAYSLSTKLTLTYGRHFSDWLQKYMPEVMLGISKKTMVHVAGSFSNMHTNNVKWDGIYTYIKHRFLSKDDVHSHFRMAAFAQGSYSRHYLQYDEIDLNADISGFQAGLIATQLKNKFAGSASFSFIKAIDNKAIHPEHFVKPNEAFNYSVSAGYLVLPREYENFEQLNVNIYTEFLGQSIIGSKAYFFDAAPAVQLIFNSNSKLNMGFRFQLAGRGVRNTDQSFLLSFEHT
ncbi:MAG: hypothetical protein ABR503_00275, partial [Chitinophagaceae bacterium]